MNLRAAIRATPWEAHETFFRAYHDAPSPSFHRQLVELMWDGPQQAGAAVFREGGKSTRGEEMLTLALLLGGFRYAVIIGSNEQRSMSRLHTIKNYLENNDLITASFGDVKGRADVWQEARIILDETCIEAYGSGQSVRGMKFLESRPDFVLIDDLEEMSKYFDNVSTPEKRETLWSWMHGDFLPIVKKDCKKFIIGSILHEDSALARLAKSEFWHILTVPIETLGSDGFPQPTWPEKFPQPWIDAKREEYLKLGVPEIFEREYMCKPASDRARTFTRDMLRFEPRSRTVEPVYVIYDPARTSTSTSCSTGRIVASWFGSKIYVWSATRYHWQPSEIIDDIIEADKRWSPVQIGVEVTGLNDFIKQPLRKRTMETGHPVPVSWLNPPRGPGKDGFILSLQPFFQAGEVILCGQEEDFKDLIEETLGFPYGNKDIINSLAYMMVIRPGVPIYQEFGVRHVEVHLLSDRDRIHIICFGYDGDNLCAVLCSWRGRSLYILHDWVCNGNLSGDIESILSEAKILVGGAKLVAYGPENDPWGMSNFTSSMGFRLMRGLAPEQGRAEIGRLLHLSTDENRLFRVASEAKWTIRAMSGGYAMDPDKKQPQSGQYRVLMEALESVVATSKQSEQIEGLHWARAKDGQKFISAVVDRPRDRQGLR